MRSLMNVLLLGSQGAAEFTPKSLPNLVLWYDGLDAATLWQDTGGTTPSATGEVVGRWDDKSVSAKHATQSDAAKKPKRYADGGVFFGDGAATFLEFSTLTTTSVSPTFFVVYDVTSLNVVSYLLAGTGTGVYAGGTYAGIAGYAITISAVIRSASEEPTDKGIVMYNPSMLRRNGKEATYSGTPGTPEGAYALYNVGTRENNTAGYLHRGRIYEIAVYDRTLSLSEMQAFETYAAAKWGITLVP